MSSKYIAYIFLLQVVGYCMGAVVNTTIDIRDHLQSQSGFSISDTYHEDTTTLPSTLPAEIRNSESKGIWLFSGVKEGGVIILTPAETTITKVTLKYYATVNMNCYYQDKATDEVEVKVHFAATVGGNWTESVFEVTREVLSTEQVIYKYN